MQWDDTLVIGVASSALFDLSESHAVFTEHGEDEYRSFQEAQYESQLPPGIAFPFIRRLLGLNDLATGSSPVVEVIVLSRNDPETGARVMRSIETHGLPMTRAVFTQGRSPYKYMPAFGMKLFLSAEPRDVAEATELGFPAGQVVGSVTDLEADDPSDRDLRIAFDFDAVLADDSAERIYVDEGIEGYHEHEATMAEVPLPPGPMKNLLEAVNRIQDLEDARANNDDAYARRLFVSIVTARNAPAHARAIKSLKSWGLRVNDGFFLGGWEKSTVLEILKPHIFFDDQMSHLEGTRSLVPSVHVPFGVKNL
ncbi:5'-nucleotidase [Nocardioides sp. Leaf374]|uniref:5'-nucleotidase n=1 Tax=Nocardioides sp. Leaf374 TaxID=2876560 RepID=UPI001E4BA510|nr:5'-nucleotidase [Nocardioides sp. Leaf374]